MVALNEISKIGFGGYRISIDSEENYNALCHALQHGCNLIDTSANYMDGKSEELIGKVLLENQQYNPFIITKAGYIQGNNLKSFNDQNNLGINLNDIITIDAQFKYSMHPVFLESQLNKSLNRLGIKQVDGFLLHNPEYYFHNLVEINFQEFYDKLKNAFEFLEEMVMQGKIRYYGISSNAFSNNDQEDKTLSLPKIFSIAQKIKKVNHFKLIQFPFNFWEQGAIRNKNGCSSIIEFANKNEIKTFSNRPLNLNSSNGSLRLAIYESELNFQGKQSLKLWENCLALIGAQLNNHFKNIDLMEIELIKFLSGNWTEFENNEFASLFFDQNFYPFLLKIYQNNIPKEHFKIYSEFRNIVLAYSLKNMNDKAIQFRNNLIKEGLISNDNNDSLPLIACRYYLGVGIDHVLIGMRKNKYVEELKSLF